MTTIALIHGSTRQGQNGYRVTKLIQEELQKQGHTVELIDPNEQTHLLTLDTPFHYNQKPTPEQIKTHEQLESADAYVVITPEYNHSFSGAIKNVLDNHHPEFADKPFLVVSYSVQITGGVRANQALRHVIPELKAIATPTQLIIPQFTEQIKEDSSTSPEMQERVAKAIQELEKYAHALKAMREQTPPPTTSA